MTQTRVRASTSSFLDSLAPRIATIDGWLATALVEAVLPENLRSAAEHAVLVGGKRLRPLLTILSCEAVGGEGEDARGPAVGIELIHAFSLVHDDLPALDNDELRRGQPTVHVRFGEAMAILAGDVLMSLAFQIAAGEGLPGEIPAELATATTRMINGQVYDTLGGFADEDRGDLDRLRLIHENKTGALISASCRMGGFCGGASPEQIDRLTTYGRAVGLMFQIVDDLLDVTQSTEHLGKAAGKDEDAGKLTFPGLLGIDASRREVESLRGEAIEAVSSLGDRGRPLADLADYMAVRTR